jgi:hypothetical protein
VTNDFERDSRSGSLKPLTVSVNNTAKLLDVGTTTVWRLSSSQRVDVIRIGRRTLVIFASLEALVAMLASPHHEPQGLGESNEGSDNVVRGREANSLSRAQSIDGNNSRPADHAKARPKK